MADIIEHTHTPAPGRQADGPQVIVGTVVPTVPSPAEEPSRPAPASESKGDGGSVQQAEESDAEELSAPNTDNPTLVDRAELSVPLPRPHTAEDSALDPPLHAALSQSTEATGHELSGTTPEILQASGNDTAIVLAVDRIQRAQTDPNFGHEFVRLLIDLMRRQKLSYAKLEELAPSSEDLQQILGRKFPSRDFVTSIVSYLAPQELKTWQQRWSAVHEIRQRSAGNRPKRLGIPAAKNSITARFCGVLSASLSYTITATFTAGLQADPGAGIINLLVYAVVGLAAFVVINFLLLLPASNDKNDNMIFMALCIAVLALIAGLIVPWVVNLPFEPWHWIADRVGLI
ncbi:hypothetical protein ABZT43_30905 [Streptomyces sp. NPDC005349]|uniref:hypothetical protein n=1 Tax=Streptomyces sp. NPDC005349 TaxID=3157037 RepID=UPI0033A86243